MIHSNPRIEAYLRQTMMLDLYTADANLPNNAAMRNCRSVKTAQQDFRTRKRYRFALGQTLLKTALAHRTATAPTEWQISRSATGRPMVRQGPNGSRDLNISLSHSGNLFVAAIANVATVGIDAERISNRPCREIARYLNWPSSTWARPHEKRCDGFFHMWTLWESLIKALPSGQSPNELFSRLVSQATPGTPNAIMSNGWFAASWHCRDRFWLSTTVHTARRPNLRLFIIDGLDADSETPQIDEIITENGQLDTVCGPTLVGNLAK
jgi:phosphopantetheinyl transferase